MVRCDQLLRLAVDAETRTLPFAMIKNGYGYQVVPREFVLVQFWQWPTRTLLFLPHGIVASRFRMSCIRPGSWVAYMILLVLVLA